MRNSALLAVVALAFTACATPASIRKFTPAQAEPQRKVERSYQIGVPNEVHVGDRMVHLRDYYIRSATQQTVRGNKDFTLGIFPIGTVIVPANMDIPVVGEIDRDGKTYRLINMPGTVAQGLRFLITDDGSFEGSAVNMANSRMGFKYTPTPADVRFVSSSATEIASDKGQLNFELVYFGTTGQSFNVAYREYTPDDLARPAFSQNLTYAIGDKTIRFRDLLINVDSATNQSIKYTVISDGLPE